MRIRNPELLLAGLLVAGTVLADTLVLPDSRNEPVNSAEGLLRPHNGQSMGQVEVQFGQPVKKSAPVGEPPITRWQYPDFTVVFEHDRVLHSVVHR